MAPPTDPAVPMKLFKLPECSGPEECLTLHQMNSDVVTELCKLMMRLGGMCPMCPRRLVRVVDARVPEPAPDV